MSFIHFISCVFFPSVTPFLFSPFSFSLSFPFFLVPFSPFRLYSLLFQSISHSFHFFQVSHISFHCLSLCPFFIIPCILPNKFFLIPFPLPLSVCLSIHLFCSQVSFFCVISLTFPSLTQLSSSSCFL